MCRHTSAHLRTLSRCADTHQHTPSYLSFLSSWAWYNKTKRAAAAAKKEQLAQETKSLQQKLADLEAVVEEQGALINRLLQDGIDSLTVSMISR